MVEMIDKQDIGISSHYFISKDQYEKRDCGEKFWEIWVYDETPTLWICTKDGSSAFGTINKRSGKFTRNDISGTWKVYTQAQKELIEYDTAHRYKIVEAVKYVDYEILKKVADIISYSGGR